MTVRASLNKDHRPVQDMRRMTTFRSTTDRIYDGSPIRL